MAKRETAISGNVSKIAVSAIKEMAIRSAQVEGVASLAWGLPSFRTPGPIRAAVERAFDRIERYIPQ